MSLGSQNLNDAARRCAASAGAAFQFCNNTLQSKSGSIIAELPVHRNPGVDDTEWIFVVKMQLEGTPESVGTQLEAFRKAALPPRSVDGDASFFGFEP